MYYLHFQEKKMLYPKNNSYRQVVDLSGFWDFSLPAKETSSATATVDYSNGFSDGVPLAVPASWNDQLMLERDNLGPAWYQTRFSCPWGFADRRTFLRFGAVNYLAEVWLNGERLGEHEGGNMAFEFEVSGKLLPTDNLLVVRVDGTLAPDRVPPGSIPRGKGIPFLMNNFPDTSYDFFPFTGIHRPVLLYAVPHASILDLKVNTEIEGSDGLVRVQIAHNAAGGTLRLSLKGPGAPQALEIPINGTEVEVELRVQEAALWGPGHPALYDLGVDLLDGSQVIDHYDLRVGIRTVEVRGDQLLLNGEPVYLTGFGRHEDFPVVGRGLLPALIIRDYEIMKWVGANSFRTSHYPYSEQMMDLADELGYLVIDETSAVGLFFDDAGEGRRLELCKQFTRELIERDRNHACVIGWSLANEPHSRGEAPKRFFKELYDLAKSMDSSRPVTVVSLGGIQEESFDFCDLVCINRYFGWYSQSGRIEDGAAELSKELDALYERFGKPILVCEFGADAVSGHHASPPEMFSEEYQAELILRSIEVMRSKPFVIGEHIWNLCDFKTAQGVIRMNSMNHKGVFTRDRRPKLAAHRLRALWKK
jgi:beta-glucuronidase